MICNQVLNKINGCSEKTGSYTAVSDEFKINNCISISNDCEFYCGERVYQFVDENPFLIQTNLLDTLNTSLTYQCPISDDEIIYEFEIQRIDDSYFGLSNPNPFSFYWNYSLSPVAQPCPPTNLYYINYNLLISSDFYSNFNDWAERIKWLMEHWYGGTRFPACGNIINELTGVFTNNGYKIKINLDKSKYFDCFGQTCNTKWEFCYAYKNIGQTSVYPKVVPIQNPFCCPVLPACQFPEIRLIDSCCNDVGVINQNALIWKGMGIIFNDKMNIQSFLIDPNLIPLDVFGFKIILGNQETFVGLFKKLKCQNIITIKGLKSGCYLESDYKYLGIPARFCSNDGNWIEWEQKILLEGDIKLVDTQKDENKIIETWRTITAPISKEILFRINSLFASKGILLNNVFYNNIQGGSNRIEGSLNYTLDIQLQKLKYLNKKNCENCND